MEEKREVKLRAYINPQVINYKYNVGFPHGNVWSNGGNNLGQCLVSKIHINPSFIGVSSNYHINQGDKLSIFGKCDSNLVHVNPQFLKSKEDSRKIAGNHENPATKLLQTARVAKEIAGAKPEFPSSSKGSYEQPLRNKSVPIMSMTNFESKKLKPIITKNMVLNNTNNVKNSIKNSMYSWKKDKDGTVPYFSSRFCKLNTNHAVPELKKNKSQELVVIRKSSRYTKLNNDRFDSNHQTNHLVFSHYLKNQSCNTKNKTNLFKFTRDKKLILNSNKTLVKAQETRKPLYSTKTKLINVGNSKSFKTKASNEKDVKHSEITRQKLLLIKKKLLLARMCNMNNKSSTIKSAALVRNKYKYTNKKLYLNKERNVRLSISRYKLDKRKSAVGTVKKKFNLNNSYSIQKLFPSYTKPCFKQWNKSTFQRSNKLQSPHLWVKNKEFVRTTQNPQRSIHCYPNRTVVKIGGILYKATQNKLTRTKGRRKSLLLLKDECKLKKTKVKDKGKPVVYVRGEKFILSKNGKTLKRQPNVQKIDCDSKKSTIKRVDIGGVTYLEKSSNVLIRTNTHHARYVVNHAKQKSIALLTSLRRRNNMPCMIYSRFGKCTRHDKGLCTYIHDPKNIAVCKKFLKGNCTETGCLLSHEAVQEKMATCHFFLKGCCKNERCPYLHVKVNSKAAICRDFLRGFCKAGTDCKKRHVHLCPEFDENGTCSRGEKCLYPHKLNFKAQSEIQKTKKWEKNKEGENSKTETTSEPVKYYSKSTLSERKRRKSKTSIKPEDSDENCTTKAKTRYMFTENLTSNRKENAESSECIPKRVKLDQLPVFIPFSSDDDPSLSTD